MATKKAEIAHEAEAAKQQYEARMGFDPINAPSKWIKSKKERISNSLALMKNDCILDFGSASCEVSEIYANDGYFIVAGDISKEMLLISQKRTQKYNRPSPHYIVFDGEYLPLRNNTFNKIICWNVIHHFVSPDKALSEIHRVLDKNGRVLFLEPLSTNPYRLLFEYRFRKHHQGIERSFRKKQFLNILENIGYEVDDVSYEIHSLPDWILKERRGFQKFYTNVSISLSTIFSRIFGSILVICRKV